VGAQPLLGVLSLIDCAEKLIVASAVWFLVGMAAGALAHHLLDKRQ